MRRLDRLIMDALDELDAADEVVYAAAPRAPRIRMRTTERRELLLHGTTWQRAKEIQKFGRFMVQTTYFALGFGNRAVATVFAHRAASRHPCEEGPALVALSVPEEVIQQLRQQRLLIARQLQDPPAIRGRVEWVLASGGVETINRNYEGLRIVRLADRLQPNNSFDTFDADIDEFSWWDDVKKWGSKWACRGQCAWLYGEGCRNRCGFDANCISKCNQDLYECSQRCG